MNVWNISLGREKTQKQENEGYYSSTQDKKKTRVNAQGQVIVSLLSSRLIAGAVYHRNVVGPRLHKQI